MASRKMTFTIPEELATQFLRRVPSRERSRYVSDAITAKLRDREDRMIRACEVANDAANVLAIERDWDALNDQADRVEEPWNSGSTR
jgi:metal-responsive CopG/Arc/MetJ family transcriptional regulator